MDVNTKRMEQLKMVMVKTNDNCISWTPKHADFFLGESFFKMPNAHFIFGKKSLESVPFIKYLHDSFPYKCLVLSRNFTFPKLIANIKLEASADNVEEPVYYVLGGKRVFQLFDRLVSEIISINVQINSINHPDSVFYQFPEEYFEVTKVARKHFDLYKQKINYDVTTYRNMLSAFTGWTSQENAYLNLGEKVVSSNKNVLFVERVSFDLRRENFPILTTREIHIENFLSEAVSLFKMYTKHFKANISQQIIKNGQHFIQLFQETDPESSGGSSPAISLISLMVYIPDCSFFRQLPYDISLYSLFLILVCQSEKNRQPQHVHLTIGNLTSVEEERVLIKKQIKRCPLPFPVLRLSISGERDSENSIQVELDNYYHWPSIS